MDVALSEHKRRMKMPKQKHLKVAAINMAKCSQLSNNWQESKDGKVRSLAQVVCRLHARFCLTGGPFYLGRACTPPSTALAMLDGVIDTPPRFPWGQRVDWDADGKAD